MNLFKYVQFEALESKNLPRLAVILIISNNVVQTISFGLRPNH